MPLASVEGNPAGDMAATVVPPFWPWLTPGYVTTPYVTVVMSAPAAVKSEETGLPHHYPCHPNPARAARRGVTQM